MMSNSDECVIIDDGDLTDDEPGPSRLVQKPKACEIESSWFEQPYQRPTGQVIDCCISSEDISGYQDLIWNQPHDRMVPGYGLTPRELASIPSDGRKGWLVSSHFYWLARCLNRQHSGARCFVFDPHLRQEACDKLLPVTSRCDVKTLVLVMCVGRRDDGVVFFGTNQAQGDHWSLAVVDVRDGAVQYCDTLGWPAPQNLTSCLVNYTRSLGLVHAKQLKINLAHSANDELHCCNDACTNYPLQTCSDVCGVVVMICMAISVLDRKLYALLMRPLDSKLNLYLVDPTEYSTYLRYVLISWLARDAVDIKKISLRSIFDPFQVPSHTPRALATRLPLKRKFVGESEPVKSPKSKNSSRFHHSEMDALSKFIVDAKTGGLSSADLLDEVVRFFTKSRGGKKQQEEYSFQKLCQRLTFNCSVERCQDHVASMREYIQEFIQRADNPIILFKMPGKEMTKVSKPLEKDDYVIALQTPYQKHLMEMYGKRCICIDVTRGSERNGMLCNVLTVSVFFEGLYEIPVAWLLSNSMESKVVGHFFEALRRSVGPFQTDIFIGDLQSELYKQWVLYFPKPEKKMFCCWEVYQVIHRQMKNSIELQTSLSSCREYLNVAHFITDQEAFEIYINALLLVAKRWSVPFCNYFREKFIDNSRDKYWATCYRVMPQSKSIPFLKSFQDNLKSIDFFNNGALGRLDTVLHKLMQLSVYLERTLVELTSEAKQETIIRDIQRKHQQRSGNFDFYSSVAGDEWCIRPSDDNNAISVLDTGHEDCDCVYKCDKCNICVHRYVCSCSMYILNVGACKHIHILHSIKRVNGAINATPVRESFSSPSESTVGNNHLGNGAMEDIDTIKSSIKKELVHISDKCCKSTDINKLNCMLTNLRETSSNSR